MSRYTDIKTEYDAFLTFLKSIDPGISEEEFRTYYIASALRIWGSNESYSEAYGELLETVTGERYSIEQLVTALGCCGEAERRLRVPMWFGGLVQRDVRQGSRYAARAIDGFGQLMAATALVNGDFTVAEARTLTEILDSFITWARNQEVSVEDAPDFTSRTTGRLEESYYRSGAGDLKRETQGEKPLPAAPEKQESVAPEPEEAPNGDGARHINIKVTIHAAGGLTQADSMGDPPADATPVQEPQEGESLESLLAELDDLVGLEGVKRDVHSLMNFIKIAKLRENRGMKVPTVSYHLVFTGNPGTGKTTVARLVARLYYQMGLLPRGQFVETDRAALVAGYLGQTAIKTQKVIQQAMGGVLFIDEAYSLAGDTEDSYGREAIETLLKAMEDHRDELVVIVAGYTELMHKFINSNPGLSSRFSKYFEFQDYTGPELLEIFREFCEKNGYRLDGEAAGVLGAEFERLFAARDRHFGNARTARNIFEKAINAQANRVA